jgi:hypothetical protein
VAEDHLERDVSWHIGSMTFLWLAVPSRPDGSSDRGLIERNSIALLSCRPVTTLCINCVSQR